MTPRHYDAAQESASVAVAVNQGATTASRHYIHREINGRGSWHTRDRKHPWVATMREASSFSEERAQRLIQRMRKRVPEFYKFTLHPAADTHTTRGVAHKVIEWRKSLNLSQAALAAALGVRQVTVSRIETGRKPGKATARKLIAYSRGALTMADLTPQADEALSPDLRRGMTEHAAHIQV